MLRQKETHSRQFQIYPRYSTSPTCWAGCGSEVTWVSWCLKLLTTWQFVQQRIQDDHKENRRLYITDLLWRESSGNCWFPSQRASNEESVSKSAQSQPHGFFHGVKPCSYELRWRLWRHLLDYGVQLSRKRKCVMEGPMGLSFPIMFQ